MHWSLIFSYLTFDRCSSFLRRFSRFWFDSWYSWWDDLMICRGFIFHNSSIRYCCRAGRQRVREIIIRCWFVLIHQWYISILMKYEYWLESLIQYWAIYPTSCLLLIQEWIDLVNCVNFARSRHETICQVIEVRCIRRLTFSKRSCWWHSLNTEIPRISQTNSWFALFTEYS